MARCKDRRGPPKLQKFDLESSGSVQPEGKAPQPKLPPVERVLLNKGFWSELPWAQRQYYAMDQYIPWPGANAVADIFRQGARRGQVLAITSCLFRATLDTGVHVSDVAFARDTYLWSTGRFFLLVSDVNPYDRTWTIPALNVGFAGTSILNQEQAVPGVSWTVFKGPGESLVARIQTIALPAGFVAPSYVGVELRGLWIPKPLFDRYNAEMER